MTAVAADLDQSVLGYMVNSSLSIETQVAVSEIQQQLEAAAPDALWLAPSDTLHITLFDLLAPLVDYGKDKDQLYQHLGPDYERIIGSILLNQPPISLHFSSVKVFPEAVIIEAQDDGSYQHIREAAMDQLNILPGTKSPPKIIHSTIARFTKPVEEQQLGKIADQLTIDIEEITTEFRLVREKKVFMRAYDLIRRYPLK